MHGTHVAAERQPYGAAHAGLTRERSRHRVVRSSVGLGDIVIGAMSLLISITKPLTFKLLRDGVPSNVVVKVSNIC